MNEEVRAEEYDERNPAEGNNELPPPSLPSLEQNEVGDMLPGRLPPTVEELAGNDMLWLIAKTCHEVNKAFCAQVCGDFSHKSWNEAPEWQRASVYDGVVNAYENPELTAEGSHSAWMMYKISDGWTHGNMKDETAKTHPNLVPWHQLHVHEQCKDMLFIAICRTMLGSA